MGKLLPAGARPGSALAPTIPLGSEETYCCGEGTRRGPPSGGPAASKSDNLETAGASRVWASTCLVGAEDEGGLEVRGGPDL